MHCITCYVFPENKTRRTGGGRLGNYLSIAQVTTGSRQTGLLMSKKWLWEIKPTATDSIEKIDEQKTLDPKTKVH